MYNDSPIVLYDYQKTRKADHPREFLKGYKGIIVADGYEVYHKLEKEESDIRIAGCWSHSRRRFANVVKALGKEALKDTLAYAALKQIAIIYKIDNGLLNLKPEERVVQRQLLVKPQVEAFFAWIKEHRNEVPAQSETGKGFTYCLNQEKYLKVFLENGYVPLDNNACEASIRGFCIGKHNWHLIDTIDGAKASAIICSIAETAKANNLKPYQYFKYLLEQIPKHMDDKNTSFLEIYFHGQKIYQLNAAKRIKISKIYTVKNDGDFLYQYSWFTVYRECAKYCGNVETTGHSLLFFDGK